MTAGQVDTVLFDLYDTLVTNDWTAHIEMVSSRLGVSRDEVAAAYHSLRDRRDGGAYRDEPAVLTAVASACGVAPTTEMIDGLVAAEADLLVSGVRWYDDSVMTLRSLRAGGYRTGVISNCSPSTRPVVERLGLEAETDVVVLSCEVGSSKPAPEIFRVALEALDAHPDGAIFVDDRADYLDGAAALGMATARIARPISHGEDSTGGGHPVITELSRLGDLL